MTMKDYSYFLFDADGTLIDTMDLIVRCFEHTCATFGNPAVAADEIMKNVGLTLREQMRVLFGPLTDERFEVIAAEHMAFQLKQYPRYLRAFPGVPEGLALLASRGKKCAVVTSRKRATLEIYLKETGLYGYFEAFITAENTQRHKPDPEPALAALTQMSAQKDCSLFVGDSSFDIECAHRAGIDSAFVNWSRNDPSGFPIQPTFFIDEVRQLCA